MNFVMGTVLCRNIETKFTRNQPENADDKYQVQSKSKLALQTSVAANTFQKLKWLSKHKTKVQ